MSGVTTPRKSPSKARENLGAQNSLQQSFAKSGSVSKIFSSEEQPGYHNLSASILQHSSFSHRFGQAERFPTIKTVGPTNYCSSPSSFTKKATSFGFGNKIEVSGFGNKDALTFPSPDRYNLKSEFERKLDKGKSFGLSYSAYEKVYIPGSKEVPPSYSKLLPGPGAYYMDRDVTADLSKITFKPKGKMFNEGLGLGSPKCSQYSPKTALTQPSRYANPTFGFGSKLDFTKSINDNPGPGAYTPPSFVDKFRKRSVPTKDKIGTH